MKDGTIKDIDIKNIDIKNIDEALDEERSKLLKQIDHYNEQCDLLINKCMIEGFNIYDLKSRKIEL